MTNRTRTIRLAAVTTLATAVVGLAAPAMAEQVTQSDPADAQASLTDIRAVSVDHGTDQVVTRVRFTDLRATSEEGPASIAIFLDTDSSKRGPEYALGSGLQSGTDYQLLKVRKWRSVGSPLTCEHNVKLRFAADVLRFKAARSCLGNPASVRVGVKMTDLYDGSHPITDWLGARRSFTTWVASS